jgi:ATP-dependent Lon protease
MFNREKNELKRVPMMPVRDMVIFPQMMQPFIVGREASVRALEEALAGDRAKRKVAGRQYPRAGRGCGAR